MDIYRTVAYLIVGVFLAYYILYPGGKKVWGKRKKEMEEFKKDKRSTSHNAH